MMSNKGVDDPRRTKSPARRFSVVKAVAAIASTLAVLAASLAFAATTATATPSPKVRICHATSSTSHPYTTPTVDESSVDEEGNQYLNGHGDHTGPVFNPTGGKDQPAWGDIIPPFTNTTVPNGSVFPGLNWTTDGQAIWNNGCQAALVYSATRTVELSQLICYDNETITVTARGTASATSTKSQTDANNKAMAAATELAEENLADELATYDDYTLGRCGEPPTYEGSGTYTARATICHDDVTFNLESTATATATSTVSEADADALAQAKAQTMAEEELADQLTGYPGYTPGECSVTLNFSASASKGLAMDICYNEGNLTVSVVGTGSATSSVSQAEADAAAQGAATTDADAKMAAELAKYGGYTAGTCPPPPEVVPPVEVVAPEAGTLPDNFIPVTVPEPATVAPLPATVPAGGGSTAPDQSLPPWALVLIGLGALGVVGSTVRLVTTRSR